MHHVRGGDSLDGQDDVAGTQVGRGGLAAGGDLEGEKKKECFCMRKTAAVTRQ